MGLDWVEHASNRDAMAHKKRDSTHGPSTIRDLLPPGPPSHVERHALRSTQNKGDSRRDDEPADDVMVLYGKAKHQPEQDRTGGEQQLQGEVNRPKSTEQVPAQHNHGREDALLID